MDITCRHFKIKYRMLSIPFFSFAFSCRLQRNDSCSGLCAAFPATAQARLALTAKRLPEPMTAHYFIFAFLESPFFTSNFRYADLLLFGTLTETFADSFPNAFAPTVFEVSFLLQTVFFFSFLHS